MPRLLLTDEQAAATLMEGQSAQLAGLPLGDNPYKFRMVASREALQAFWTKGYMMSEQQGFGPVDPETGAPILEVVTKKQLEGDRK